MKSEDSVEKKKQLALKLKCILVEKKSQHRGLLDELCRLINYSRIA